MRAFTIKAKTLDSAQSLFDALRRFDPALAGTSSDGYSVSVDVGESDRRILEVLDAIHEHVEKGHSLVRVEMRRAAIHHQPDRTLAASAGSAHRKVAMHRHGRAVLEWFDNDRVHQRVHDREAEPAVFLGRGLVLPPAVVADGEGNGVVRDRSLDLDQVRGRLLRVLDRVGERLGHCQLDLEQLTTRCIGLGQPSTEVTAKNGHRFRQRLKPKLQRRLGLSQIKHRLRPAQVEGFSFDLDAPQRQS